MIVTDMIINNTTNNRSIIIMFVDNYRPDVTRTCTACNFVQ